MRGDDDLVRCFVMMWREVVTPRPTDAQCWKLDRMIRAKWGGQRVYVRSWEYVEREWQHQPTHVPPEPRSRVLR